MWTAAILAGGGARRFGGQDKSGLLIGGISIIERQMAAVRPVAAAVLIVANDPGRYGHLDVPVVGDLISGKGALGGLYTAITASRTDRTLVLACDLPFLTTAFLEWLVSAGQHVDIAIPRTTDGYQPLCACYAKTCAQPIRRRLDAGVLKVTDVLDDVHVREIGPAEIAPFDPRGRLFLNINTPDDYTRASGFDQAV